MIKELCGLNAAPPATNAWQQRPSGAHYLWKHDDDDFTSPQITELSSIQWTVWDLALLDICNHSKSRICPLLKRMWWHYYMFAYIMCLRHFLGKGNKQKASPSSKVSAETRLLPKIWENADFDFAQILSLDSSFKTNMINDHQMQTHILAFRAFSHSPITPPSSSPPSLSWSQCSPVIKLDDTAQGGRPLALLLTPFHTTSNSHHRHHPSALESSSW